MRLICSMAVLLCLSSTAAEKEPEKLPPVLTPKDSAAFQSHFNLIMDQLKRIDKPAITKESMHTLESAFATLIQHKPDQKINCCLEYHGWFFFSSMGLARGFNIKDPGNLTIIFHNGFAVRKGDTKIYAFGFW